MKMTIKSLAVAGAIAAAAVSAPAMALPAIGFTQNNYALPSYTTATVFQNFNAGTPGTLYTPRANETVTGIVMTQDSTVPGVSTSPYAPTNGNNYLNIFSGSYSVSFAAPVQFFSFVIGSIDSYNSVRLNYEGGGFDILRGQQIIGGSTAGPLNTSTSGRVWYDVSGGRGISSVVFSSGMAALEIDGLAAAVPEPATWGMMILGLGMVGGAMRTRRRTVRFAA